MLDAAMQLIERHGSGVSLAKIAGRAGFSHGLVMTRFRSKAGLVKAVTQRIQEKFITEIMHQSAHKSGLDAVLAMADIFARPPEAGTAAGRAFYVLLGESLGPDKDLRAAFVAVDEAFRAYLVRHLQEAVQRGDIAPTEPVETVAFLLVSLFRGAAIQKMINRKATHPATLAASMRAAVLTLVNARSPQ